MGGSGYMQIRNIDVPVNIWGELEPHLDHFREWKIRGDKFQCTSCFRHEKHASMAINLETGVWIDSGSPTDQYHKGNFVSLLAYLRQEEYQDTEMYLFQAYHVMLEEVDSLQLKIDLQGESEVGVTYDWFKDFPYLQFRHPYLLKRGITKEVQRLFCIGFDKEHEAIAMPWFNMDKKVINVKYRSIRYKQFFYLQDGQLTRNYVYGLPQCKSLGYKDVDIVESEIDCMYLWSNGIPAVAMGHAGINKNQIQLLLNAGIETVTFASDNDEAGERFRVEMGKKLPKLFTCYELEIPYMYKDVNNIPQKELKQLQENRRYSNISLSIRL